MHSNYLKVAVRKFGREKLYSLINLAGLSLAIACCLILGQYLRGELTYDQHNLNHDRIYRVASEYTSEGSVQALAETSYALGPMMAEEFEEIEHYAMVAYSISSLYKYEDQAFYWKVFATNERIFDVLTHEVIYGDIETALLEGSGLAVSETFAKTYFGDVNPIGEIVTNDVGVPLTIDLVFADLPENSHLQYDALLSTNRAAWNLPEDIGGMRRALWFTRGYTYFQMSEDFDPTNFAQMAAAFYDRHMAEQGREFSSSVKFWLEPITDIHYQSDLLYDEPSGNRAYLYALTAVALFILLVACINYINLATARSIRHARGVGIRKILGANKGRLVAQFLSEAILLALVSTLMGLVLVELVLSYTSINELLGKNLDFSLIQEPKLLLWLVLFSLVVGSLAGIYPALYLSSWAPLSGLVSDTTGSKANLYFRKLLVLTQFTVSVAVVASTLLMAEQMKFLSDKALGFDKENRVVITLIGRELLAKSTLIETELMQYPNILGVTSSEYMIGENMPHVDFSAETEDGQSIEIALTYLPVEPDYIEVMGSNIVLGRTFSEDLGTDSDGAYVVNETLVDRMGWHDPIGKVLAEYSAGDLIERGRVIGVAEDFHFQSLRQTVGPFAMRIQEMEWEVMDEPGSVFQTRYMTVNLAGENIRETINYLEERFNEFDSEHPFQVKFLDDSLDQLYRSEQNLMRLIGIFAGICIFIACLGLFGLASFTTEQRSKEIGIRKTLGATTMQIILLLSKNILVLVLAGAVVGCAVAYLAISNWLGNFAYRVDMSLLPYVLSTLAALAVAYATVALQSYKSAQSDPVDALRYE